MSRTILYSMIGAGLIAFAASALLGIVLIPALRRLKFGQTIRDIGPTWHKSKEGIPTMGGFLFIIGTALALAIVAPLYSLWRGDAPSVFPDSLTNTRLVSGVILMFACGAIGFADDFIKVRKKRNLGLTEFQKLFCQLVVGTAYALSLYMAGDHVQAIPFVGEIDLGLWFVPICVLIIAGYNNAVNFTDGVDGLCGSVTFMALLPFIVLAGYEGTVGQGLIAAALCGGLLGYLIWNLHPAKVFMGDVGSLFLGGALCALAFGMGRPLILIPIGIIYIIEILSVVLQVTYFKLTHGKRLFKMSPIHHHFEMSGWKENKIVTVFSAITLAGSAVALLIELWL